jgi:hypothetical protein
MAFWLAIIRLEKGEAWFWEGRGFSRADAAL